MNNPKNVMLIGAGAIGSFFAPKLLEAQGPGHFHIIADGERKKKLTEQGLNVNGQLHRFPILSPGDCGHTADLILIGVKSLSLEQALDDIAGFVGPDTIIMPLLNGVSSEKITASRFSEAQVMPSFMRVSVVRDGNSCSYDTGFGVVYFGEADGTITQRAKDISILFDAAGIGYKLSENIIFDIWFKFMANIGENLTCALLGVPFGSFTNSEHTNYIRIASMMEVISIANKLGIGLGQAELDRQVQTIAKIPYANKPSTLQDLEAGRLTEIDMFAGEVLRLGKENEVPTPINAMLYHAIRALEEKNDGRFNVK